AFVGVAVWLMLSGEETPAKATATATHQNSLVAEPRLRFSADVGSVYPAEFSAMELGSVMMEGIRMGS
ncbi:hypothetical protein, partial [Xylella fastidiosa]|uniref:hypothetical protein n=1 Tax=Xylella fastidiosa TaxID=2371 RepID=UPI001EEACB2D